MMLSVLDCYQNVPVWGDKESSEESFFSWPFCILVLIAILLLMFQRYISLIVGLIISGIFTLNPIAYAALNNMLAEMKPVSGVTGEWVFLPPPKQIFLMPAYIYLMVGAALFCVHFILCRQAKKNKEEKSQ